MKTNFSAILALIFLIAVAFFINYCQHKMPVQPDGPCKDNQLAEDTTRVYFRTVVDVDGTIALRDTLPIYPKAIFARFYPWVKDTTKIRQLAKKHHLRLRVPPSSEDQQLTAILCVTDDRRAEYHFTPYGKEGFCNFGADSLVEYAFGIFADGRAVPSGNIFFKFVEGTPETRIDSLFGANGLRLLYTRPDIPSGKIYNTVMTPRSNKNVLDLGYELNFISFVTYASIAIGTYGANPPLRCDQ
jgi:hypothetical protein